MKKIAITTSDRSCLLSLKSSSSSLSPAGIQIFPLKQQVNRNWVKIFHMGLVQTGGCHKSLNSKSLRIFIMFSFLVRAAAINSALDNAYISRSGCEPKT